MTKGRASLLHISKTRVKEKKESHHQFTEALDSLAHILIASVTF